MGNFYTNITTFGPTQDEIRDALKQLRCPGYVSPTINGYTVICDRLSEPFGDDFDDYEEATDSGNMKVDEGSFEEQDNAWRTLAQTLSEKLSCVAIAVRNHDDDILEYQLYERGGSRDTYNSAPNYFDEEGGGLGAMLGLAIVPRLLLPRRLKEWLIKRSLPSSFSVPAGGDARLLCQLFGKPEAETRVETILRKTKRTGNEFLLTALLDSNPDSMKLPEANDENYLFDIQRHQDLAQALGFPDFTAGAGYRYVKDHEVENAEDWVLVEA